MDRDQGMPRKRPRALVRLLPFGRWTTDAVCSAQTTMEALMSWMPSNDPTLGDPVSCDALELVIVPRTRDLGDGFQVRRALPHGSRQMVGPFIFFDHFGPVQFVSGNGMDVRPHPHIGLATVTYLFDGAIMHRDSEGNIREIEPGAMNLMTAGRGIAHSERTPDCSGAPARTCSACKAGSRCQRTRKKSRRPSSTTRHRTCRSSPTAAFPRGSSPGALSA